MTPKANPSFPCNRELLPLQPSLSPFSLTGSNTEAPPAHTQVLSRLIHYILLATYKIKDVNINSRPNIVRKGARQWGGEGGCSDKLNESFRLQIWGFEVFTKGI